MNQNMPQTERRGERLRALAADVLDPSISVAATRIDGFDGSELLGVEIEAIAKASQRRRAEFTAGRVAARMAMGSDDVVPMGADRAPVWPDGWRGSITHSRDWALAAVSRGTGMIGLDLEPAEPLPEDVIETVLWNAEKDWIDRCDDPGLMARVVFSAKECAYKAQYPITRRLFGFGVFLVTVHGNRFRAEFQQEIGRFQPGDSLDGRFSIGGGFILTGIAL